MENWNIYTHYIKLRKLLIDNKNGNLHLEVDYIHATDVKPIFTMGEVADMLGDGLVIHFGYSQSVNVSIKSGEFSSDYFSPNSDHYYP